MDSSPAPRAEPLPAASPVAALRGYVAVLVSAMFLSMTGIFIKILLTVFALPPLALAFWRVAFVTLAVGVALALFKPGLLRIRARDLPMFALYGLVGIGIHQLVWIGSVSANGAAIATVLVYIQPALVALFSWRFLRERIDRIKLFALVLTLAGVVLVSAVYRLDSPNVNLFGILVGVLTGVTFGTYALLSRLATRRYSAWTCLFYAFAFGAAFLLPLQFISAAFLDPRALQNLWALGTAWQGWGILLLLALGPTLSGFALYTIGLSHLPASVVTIIGALEPVFSIVLAYFLFHEVLDPLQLLGAGLILWSVILLRPR